MDYSESHERKLYEAIKMQVTVEKSFAKILLLENELDESKCLVSNDLNILDQMAATLIRTNKPYVVLDHLKEELIYVFNGKYFFYEENLTKNEILKFDLESNNRPTDAKICSDIEKLRMDLRKTKGA